MHPKHSSNRSAPNTASLPHRRHTPYIVRPFYTQMRHNVQAHLTHVASQKRSKALNSTVWAMVKHCTVQTITSALRTFWLCVVKKTQHPNSIFLKWSKLRLLIRLCTNQSTRCLRVVHWVHVTQAHKSLKTRRKSFWSHNRAASLRHFCGQN